METLKSFLTNNYILITVIACLLILSLIGYLSENLKNEQDHKKVTKPIPSKIKVNKELKKETKIKDAKETHEIKETTSIEDDADEAPNLGIEE